MKRTVIVIGGGASGMMAAIQAARAGARVTVLEHTDRVGKKILSTGNGKCNLTNLYQGEECYRSQNHGFPLSVIEKYSVADTLQFFEKLGILPKNKNGYVYPNSEQASAVLDVLRMELDRLGVHVVCGCEIRKTRRASEGGFEVTSSLGPFHGDSLILAAGSKAAPKTGSDGSGYEIARRLGHTVIPPLPALVQLQCREKHYKQLAGIRTEAKLTLYVDGRETDTQTGELQLTDYGISGIPTFQLSRYASVALNGRHTVKVRIDFLPGQTMEESKAYLERRKKSMGEKTAEEWMTGLLNKKLAAVLLKLAGISLHERIRDVDQGRWGHLVTEIKAYETVVAAANSYDNAQICCGGVDTQEVDPETMESKRIPRLYLAGELLDVDGICGGYNLQWAWSSGAVAGIHAAGKRKVKDKENSREKGKENDKVSSKVNSKDKGNE